MMNGVFARHICTGLALIMAAPFCVAQKPVVPQVSAPIGIAILEGNNAVNSVSLLRSTAPVVEVQDENKFPLEGAVVVFKLPEQGPGGVFATGGTSFTTRSDSHGQAAGPLLTPRLAGKFQITVTATLGDRTAEAVIHQTNQPGSYFGPTAGVKKPWYRRRTPLLIAGAGVAAGAVVAVILLTRSSTPNTVGVTPGVPVFH